MCDPNAVLGTVRSIHLYPVKGLHGIDLDCAWVERRGLRHDRRWMVVGQDGVFRSQRQIPKMATIRTSIADDGLCLQQPFSSIMIPLEPAGEFVTVRVWRSRVVARAYGSAADRWLTEALGEPVRLVKMTAESRRDCDPAYSLTGDEVSFADGFPVLLTSHASLCDLNSRLSAPVPMSRFRPNVTFEGWEAWGEDSVARVSVGSVSFRNAKPCGRCLVTTIDQDTGVSTGDEPLRTLAGFRTRANSANFGVNLIPDEEGWIRVGDEIRAME